MKQLRMPPHASRNRLPGSHRKPFGQRRFDAFQHVIDARHHRSHALPHTGSATIGQASPVAGLDVAQAVVRVLVAADGHGQPGALVGDVIAAVADDGPRGQDVVERCELPSPAVATRG